MLDLEGLQWLLATSQQASSTADVRQNPLEPLGSMLTCPVLAILLGLSTRLTSESEATAGNEVQTTDMPHWPAAMLSAQVHSACPTLQPFLEAFFKALHAQHEHGMRTVLSIWQNVLSIAARLLGMKHLALQAGSSHECALACFQQLDQTGNWGAAGWGHILRGFFAALLSSISPALAAPTAAAVVTFKPARMCIWPDCSQHAGRPGGVAAAHQHPAGHAWGAVRQLAQLSRHSGEPPPCIASVCAACSTRANPCSC